MADGDISARRNQFTKAQQAQLEQRLRGKRGGEVKKSTIQRQARASDPPASFAQQRLWLIDQLGADNGVNNIGITVQLTGDLNIEVLERSINEIIARHEVLRTSFESKSGIPVQIIAPSALIRISLNDLRHEPGEARLATAYRLAADAHSAEFDLSTAPLVRTYLFRIEINEYLLLISIHHIAGDGWSAGIFYRELSALYAAFLEDKPSPLQELAFQYADYTLWQYERLSGKLLEEQLEYWRTQLAGLPPLLELPTTRPRPPVQRFDGSILTTVLPATLAEQLKALMQSERVTLFMLLLAAFGILLYRYTEQEDIAVGAPIANRPDPELEKLIGFFVNTLVMRCDLSGQPNFYQLLERIKEVAFGAYANQELPFEKLLQELQPERSLSHSPLFQALFALQNAPAGELKLPNLTMKPVQLESRVAQFDLSLIAAEGEELSTSWNYNTDLYDLSTIERMALHFETLLQGIVADPTCRITEIPLLTESEQRQLCVEWNGDRKSYSYERSLSELFEEQVRLTPDRIGIIFESELISYQELNTRANRLAHYLRFLGVGPEVIVEICVERSIEMVTGLFAILKSGGAYMPLDPTYPKDRLAIMRENADSPVLLTQKHLLDRVPPAQQPVFCIDSDWEMLAADLSESEPSRLGDPDNIIACIQTSGSTGKPKGVMITRRGFQHLCLWYQALCPFTEHSSSLLMMTFSFDAAFKNIVVPLISGGRLILANPGYYDSTSLLNAIVDNSVDLIMTTPSQLYSLLDAAAVAGDYRDLATVECLMLGGESTLWSRVTPWIDSGYCHSRFLNMYGPVECTDALTAYQVDRERMDMPGGVPIGMPIDNAYLYVLDSDRQLRPVDISGELYVGGEVVSRGYLKMPELTAERFGPNPFEAGERMYRTGDLGKRTSDGNLEFLGRLDHQVKIRGQRVELDEVQAVINRHPGVRENIVVAREYSPEEKRLVAYLVAESENGKINLSELKSYLREKLPQYMVPHYIMPMDCLPLLSNGKVDRRALPEPDWNRTDDSGGYVAPRNEVEQILAEIWSSLLRIDSIGVHDDFFERGGHSLLATQVMSRLASTLKITVPLRSLFEKRTIAQLAIEIEEMIIKEITQSNLREV